MFCSATPNGNQRSGNSFLKRRAEVGVDNHDVEAFLLETDQRGTQGLTRRSRCRRLRLSGSRHAPPPSSRMASSNCSALGAAPWNAGLFSNSFTPLPFTVSKM